MKTIFNLQIKLLQSKYGNNVYFILLYQLGKIIVYSLGLATWGVIAWLFITQGYLSQSIYEQLALVVSLLFFFLLKKEKQVLLIPCITKLTVSKIKKYIFIKELYSLSNFILFPLIIPVLILSETMDSSIMKCILLFIVLWQIGLLLNLLSRIIKYYCIKHKFLFISALCVLLIYCITILLFYRTRVVFSYSDFNNIIFYIPALLTGIMLLIPMYFYVIKLELYQIYEDHHSEQKGIQRINFLWNISNIFMKIFLVKYLRCKVFDSFLTLIVKYIIAGVVIYLLIGSKVIGIGLFLSIYAFNILPFTIYLSSNYFDGLFVKQISIKHLISSSFFLNFIITTILFFILLVCVLIFDKQYILPLVSMYLFVSGPFALILLCNVWYAEKFNLFPVQSDFVIQQTFQQSVIKTISIAFLLGCATFISISPKIGCYIVISISTILLITSFYWINIIYEGFMKGKYQILEKLR